MASDRERREVARRLRETGEELGSAALLWYHIAKALGVRTATDGKTACGMLADLIEPPIRCPHYMHPCCRTDAGGDYIDRDALLALADEIEGSDVTYCVSAQYVLDSYADRIREALGVEK